MGCDRISLQLIDHFKADYKARKKKSVFLKVARSDNRPYGVYADHISTTFDNDALNRTPSGFSIVDGISGRSDIQVAGGSWRNGNEIERNNYLYWNATGLKKRTSRKFNAPRDFATIKTDKLSLIDKHHSKRY